MTSDESEHDTFEKLNNPKVIAAFATLMEFGLLALASRRDVFCAWCGNHICWHDKGVAAQQVKSAVDAHRENCADFKRSVTP